MLTEELYSCLLVAVWLLLVVEGGHKDLVKNMEHWLLSNIVSYLTNDTSVDLAQRIWNWNILDDWTRYEAIFLLTHISTDQVLFTNQLKADVTQKQ
jgi:hypothetical protein